MRGLVTCPYCGMNCRVMITKEISLSYRVDSPPLTDVPNESGKRCFFGNTMLKPTFHARLKHPMKATERGKLVETGWEETLREITLRLREYSPEDIAFIGNPYMTNEAAYLFQKLARSLGTNNVDGLAIDYRAFALALAETGTWDAIPRYGDIPKADLLVLWGINPAESAPLLMRWIALAKRKGTRVVLVDPHRTRTSRFAEVFLSPFPGTDSALAMAVMNSMLSIYPEKASLLSKEALSLIENWGISKAAEVTGLAGYEVEKFCDVLLSAERGTFIIGPGISMGFEPYATAGTLITLAHLLGFSVLPFPRAGNSRGVLEMGLSPDFLPGLETYESAGYFARKWRLEEIPTERGAGVAELLAGKRVSVVYLIGETATLLPVEEILERADFVVFQGSFQNDLLQFADVVLPSTAFPEGEGSTTNAEGRVQWSDRVKRPPGKALPDWAIFSKILERLRLGFSYSTPEEVLREISTIVPGYSGADPRILKRKPEGVFVSHKKGTFMPFIKTPQKNPERVIVFTHQFRSIWRGEQPEEPEAKISVPDGMELGMRGEGEVKLGTPNGDIKITARVSSTVLKGTLRVPWERDFARLFDVSSDEKGCLTLKLAEWRVGG